MLNLGIEASQQSLGRVGGKLAGHIGENRYVAGLAEDGRSKCQSILCRAYLAPGEPRIGKRAPSVTARPLPQDEVVPHRVHLRVL